MTNQTIIQAGYRLSITSWENDGDAYHTEIIEGITKERVEFLLELCRLFRSKHQSKGCFGNMYEGTRAEREEADAAIKVVMEKHYAVLNKYELDQLGDGHPEFAEMVSDLLGSGDGYTYRVYARSKVEYIPHEIRIKDVTKEFNT